MVCGPAKTVVDVPVDVAQDLPAGQQFSKCPGAHLFARKDPVGVSVGRCVRDEDGGFIEDGLNQKEVPSDLLVRLLVASADEWRAVLVSCNATRTKIETPAVNGPDLFVLIAEVDVIVVAHDVAHRCWYRTERRDDDLASLHGLFMLQAPDQQIACKYSQIRGIFRRGFWQPFVNARGAVDIRNRKDMQDGLPYCQLEPSQTDPVRHSVLSMFPTGLPQPAVWAQASGAGRSEFQISRKTFHDPSACLRQIVMTLKVSLITTPPGNVTVAEALSRLKTSSPDPSISSDS